MSTRINRHTRRQDVTQVRQPRPAPRRQGTRHAVVTATVREG